MIRCLPPDEPDDFDSLCRQPGLRWLAKHPEGKNKPRNLWSAFKGQLREGFERRCAYGAMYEAVGTVDHFRSQNNRPDLAYEWTNYRFCEASMNSRKRNHDDAILDPFEVEDGWFEVLLPSMQMVATKNVPLHLRAKAEFTLDKLALCDGETHVRLRREWYEQFVAGAIGLEGLRRFAPLVARAVEKQGG
ncbi:MAG: hypothetical protein AAGC60_20350 [Acidobacteriota bacterium]